MENDGFVGGVVRIHRSQGGYEEEPVPAGRKPRKRI